MESSSIKYQQKEAILESGTCKYIDEGSSDTVLVLIHGLGLERSVTPIIDSLAEEIRVIVPSLPFITNSTFTKEHTTRGYVQHLQDLLKALGVDRFCVFGNSIGGTLALLWAQSHPTAVDKVIARAPLFTRKQLPLIARYKFLLDFYSKLSENRVMLDALFSVLIWQFKAAIHQGSHMDIGNHDANQKIEGFKKQAEGYAFKKSLRDFLLDTTRKQLGQNWSKIETKTLILWGKDDPLFDARWAERIYNNLPHSELHISDRGHNMINMNRKTSAH